MKPRGVYRWQIHRSHPIRVATTLGEKRGCAYHRAQAEMWRQGTDIMAIPVNVGRHVQELLECHWRSYDSWRSAVDPPEHRERHYLAREIWIETFLTPPPVWQSDPRYGLAVRSVEGVVK